ncbi:hypothetical protein BJ508DRAFT_362079 [Ascobolus immersus RN42]|uniref:RRM domain-containing protein n=1 Tax=Ascobolus immersus RN42 TaxID=1160509 RepID=A0A3N4I5C2_ASCIM|nr:hypothetical protein BJ508DRAFT_362079 [Ascobolus immersus RN42]
MPQFSSSLPLVSSIPGIKRGYAEISDPYGDTPTLSAHIRQKRARQSIQAPFGTHSNDSAVALFSPIPTDNSARIVGSSLPSRPLDDITNRRLENEPIRPVSDKAKNLSKNITPFSQNLKETKTAKEIKIVYGGPAMSENPWMVSSQPQVWRRNREAVRKQSKAGRTENTAEEKAVAAGRMSFLEHLEDNMPVNPILHRCLRISNLYRTGIDAMTILQFFEPYGAISVVLPLVNLDSASKSFRRALLKKGTTYNKGFAYILFDTEENACTVEFKYMYNIDHLERRPLASAPAPVDFARISMLTRTVVRLELSHSRGIQKEIHQTLVKSGSIYWELGHDMRLKLNVADTDPKSAQKHGDIGELLHEIALWSLEFSRSASGSWKAPETVSEAKSISPTSMTPVAITDIAYQPDEDTEMLDAEQI